MITIQKKIADISSMEQLAQVYRTEAELTRSYGNHTLAFFGLAPENLHFLTPDGTGLVNYRLVRNVAVVLGDPVCAPEAFEQVTRSFLDFCALQYWHVAFYQASPERLTTYRALQLRAFKMGEEAITHPQTFTLNSSAVANVRISARRAERDEVVIHWHEGVPPVEVMHQLEQISDAWLERRTGQHASEMSFSRGRLDELIDTADRADRVASISPPSHGSHRAAPRVVTEVATTSAGKPCAFVTFIPVYGSLTPNATTTSNQSEVLSTNPSLQQHCVSELSQLANEASPLPLRGQASCKAYCSPEASMRGEGWGWSLDLMRRAPDAPPGVMELLLVRAIERFQSCGAQIVSLGMVAMADTRQEMTPAHWQFLRYCLVGGANTLIDWLTLNVLLWRFPTNNVQVLVLYNSIAYTSGALSSFFFNKYWTFQHKQRTTWRVVVRFAISLVLEVLYNNALVWLAGKALQPVIANPVLWGNVSKLIAVVCGTATSYALMRFWIFAGGSPPTLPVSSVTELERAYPDSIEPQNFESHSRQAHKLFSITESKRSLSHPASRVFSFKRKPVGTNS